jgi:hypothetical protein
MHVYAGQEKGIMKAGKKSSSLLVVQSPVLTLVAMKYGKGVYTNEDGENAINSKQPLSSSRTTTLVKNRA